MMRWNASAASNRERYATQPISKEEANIMDLKSIKDAIVTHVYHIPLDKKVPLHKHDAQDEIFYCIKGSGFGVLEDSEVELNVGDAFLAPAGTLHSLRSDGDLYVTAVLVPVVDER